MMELDFKELSKLKPYKYEYKKGFLFYNGFYEIYYDDTKISIVPSKKEAKDLVGMLNGAFLEGYLQAYATISRENEKH